MFEYKITPADPSSWNTYPTAENPSTKYKFTSIEIMPSMDQLVINRNAYGALDYLGDLGGLIDAFIILGNALISPVAGFALNSRLLSSIFKQR